MAGWQRPNDFGPDDGVLSGLRPALATVSNETRFCAGRLQFVSLRGLVVRILLISAEPIRLRQASDTHVNEIVKCLRADGHDVTLCVTRVMGPYQRTPLVRRSAAYLIFWLETLRRLHRVELVYARSHPVNFPIALAAWAMGIPIVHEINGSYYDVAITHSWLAPFMGLISALQRFQYRKANALIAVTHGLASWVRNEAPGVAVETVPNGTNCEIFNPEHIAVKPITRDYALFFGSVTRWHGIETMIAAVNNEAWPGDLDLVVVGEGQLGEMVQQAAKTNPRIHAVASIPQETLVGYITGAAVGLVPINSVGGRGRYGLSPLKLYEMLACGLPVIVTDFPDQADLVRSLDAGLVVPPDDPAALARAVAELRANPPTREKMMKVASIIKAEHSWDVRVAEIEKVLTSVVEQRKQ
jgi:glycosyltransferase involved in cell wall biosynthesis